MKFSEELARLSDAATQGEWMVNNLHRPVPQACLMSYVCGPFDDSKDCVSVGSENASDHHLIALLAKRRREILALVESARQASFCLRELLPDDIDAKMTVAMLDAALANLDEVKP